MNKLEIEYRRVSELMPYENNVMDHSIDQVADIAASIREYGFNNPVLIDSNSLLVAGHGRLLAAKELGMEEVPCLVLGHLSDSQRRAYAIADNKIPRKSTFNLEVLASELDQLAMEEVDLSPMAFTQTELDAILSHSPELPQELAYTPNYSPMGGNGKDTAKDEGEEQDYSSKNREIDIDDFEEEMAITLKYSEQDYFYVKSALTSLGQESMEQALLSLLKSQDNG